MIKASLTNGVGVWWDGRSRAYIDVPGSFKGQVKVGQSEKSCG